VADNSPAVLSPHQWGNLPERRQLVLPTNDQEAAAFILAHLARPKLPQKALKFIDDIARWCTWYSTGKEHPKFPRRNQKRKELEKRIEGLADGLGDAFDAGQWLARAYVNATESQSPEARSIRDLVKYAMENSDPQLAEYEEGYPRRKLWERFIPVAHLALAVRHHIDIRGHDLPRDYAGRIGTIGNILFRDLGWVSGAIEYAERISFQVARDRALPGPERMIRFAQQGSICP
jgi:hypothetical protein